MRPNIWGEGLLFAFSGWDGPTDWAEDFVCVAEADPFAWSLEGSTPVRFRLQAAHRETLPIAKAEVISGDHLSVRLAADDGVELEVRMAMRDRHSAIGSVKAIGRDIDVTLKVVRPEWCPKVESDPGRLALSADGRSVAFHLDHGSFTEGEGGLLLTARAPKRKPVLFGISRNPDWTPSAAELKRAFADRGAFFRTVPDPRESFFAKNPTDRARTFLKAASVIKVNLHSSQGAMPYSWSTPDRVPHRDMWLWDSAFHAVALRHLNPFLAQEQILSVLAHLRDDGFLPHSVRPDGTASTITQPPILGWAAWKVHESRKDPAFLAKVYPPLKRFLGFFPAERDRDRNDLCEWESGGASGMDNSPRFDAGADFDALDLNCFLVSEYRTMARMTQALGGDLANDTELWNRLADEISRRINALLWDEDRGFYCDRRIGGDLAPLKTVCGFLPLFAHLATAPQAERLVEHLRNPREFWTPFPVPSVAREEATYSKDMWRGPTWANYNYLVIEGLHRYGYDALARELAERTIDEISRWYQKEGVIFELYDAEAEDSPRRMPRKGRVGGENWLHTVIRDYHWTASVYLALALEEFGR